MPTNYTDQFFSLDPAAPPGFGTSLNFTQQELIDQNDDNLIDANFGDTIGGPTVTESWPGDTVTIFVPGAGLITYEGITFYLDGAYPIFTPTDGQILQNGFFISATAVDVQGSLDVGDLGPPCFTAGTFITAKNGEVAIEDLKPGDLVWTQDHGLKPVLWIGRTRVDGRGDFAPVKIKAGQFGLTRDLTISPQHRILISDWRAEYLFGYSEVLVPAISLVNGRSVKRLRKREIEYFHLLFESHEIVRSNGALTESFYPGNALIQADAEAEAELIALFPQLADPTAPDWPTARPTLRVREARVFSK